MVALTLPEDAIDRLRRVHRDLGWAIVKLLDQAVDGQRKGGAADTQPDVELVTVADRRSLIVVNREVIRNLPGVNIIPLNGTRAFLALDIDRGMSDLELGVTDRLAEPGISRREREALTALRSHLMAWRHDASLQIHTRAIIVVEQRAKRPARRVKRAPGTTSKRRWAKTWAQSAKTATTAQYPTWWDGRASTVGSVVPLTSAANIARPRRPHCATGTTNNPKPQTVADRSSSSTGKSFGTCPA
jgi:hypothetical protein